MLAWLHSLGAEPQPPSVRARAAAATGQLAQWDLPYCLHRLIKPWARSTAAGVRQGAALALTVCGSSATHSAQIWQLLFDWCGAEEEELALTAVAVLGGSLASRGDDSAATAMGCLRHAVDGQLSWELVPAIVANVLSLAAAGRMDAVLAALSDWTRDAEAAPVRLTGLLAFLTVAADCTTARSGVSWWPVLLTAEPRLRRRAAVLWARALNAKAVRGFALDVLRSWCDFADSVTAAHDPLARVAAGIAGQGDRQAERLRYWLHRWSTDRAAPSATAKALLTRLEVNDR